MKQQWKSYCKIATNDANSSEKIRNSEIHEMNRNPEKRYVNTKS